MSPALAARESMIYGDEDAWTAEAERHRKRKPSSSINGMFLVLVLGLVVSALWLLPKGSAGPRRASRTAFDWAGAISRVMPRLPARTWQHDFSTGSGEWLGGLRNSDWSLEGGQARPGRLRILRRSVEMADYQFEFEGQIERKALNWAFRAPDVQNYYACKLMLPAQGEGTGSEIMHMVVLDGKEQQRVRLPIPLTLRRDTTYRVRISVSGNRFRTWVNNQVVDSWTDTRLKTGGVGFFSEKGELSAVRWVSVSNHDSFFSKLFAFVTLLGPGPGPF